jgi:hypothetical protein
VFRVVHLGSGQVWLKFQRIGAADSRH